MQSHSEVFEVKTSTDVFGGTKFSHNSVLKTSLQTEIHSQWPINTQDPLSFFWFLQFHFLTDYSCFPSHLQQCHILSRNDLRKRMH